MKKKKRLSLAVSEAMEPRRFFSSVNILTHHVDAQNDGANVAETVLTPANVNPLDFGKQFGNGLDGGDVIAEPLYLQNVSISTGASPGIHSVTIVATEADGLYALDANTGAVLWHDNFTNITDPTNLTPTTGVTTILQSDIAGNPDVGSQLGILATPAIDASTGTMYLNANTKEIRSDGKHFVQRLWSISIRNGVPTMAPAVVGDTIAPDGVALDNNNVAGPYTYVSGPIINGTGNNDPYNSSGDPIPVSYPDIDGWTAAPGGATGYVIAFNAIEQMERTAVTLVNGSVYLGFASHGDTGPYYGWVLGYRESNLALDAAFNTTPTFEPASIVGESQPFESLGGIWMSGSNIASDGTNLYVVTGNGAFNGEPSNFNSSGFALDHDYGDSVLKLSPDSSTQSSQNGNGWGLKIADYFTPSNQVELNDLDLDLGSGGATLLPNSLLDSAGNPMLVVQGKESQVYLLDRNNLGKYNYTFPLGASTADPAPYDRVVGEFANNGTDNDGEQMYTSATYYDGNIYVGVNGQPALELSVAALEAGTATGSYTSGNFGYPGETFEISSNANTNGIAWAENPGVNDLLAYNAENFTSPIYDSKINPGDSLGGSIHFHVPTEIEGMVYAGSRGGGLSVYGLDLSYLSSNPLFFGEPTGLTNTLVSTGDIHLSWTSNSSLANEFRIDRSNDGTNWTTLGYVAGSVTSFDDTAFNANTKYQYRVVGVSGLNLTPFSNVVTFAPPLILQGQSFYLRLDPNGTNVDFWTNSIANGGVVQSIALSQLSGISFVGTATTGNNFTVDFSNGNPLPASGLNFNGGSGVNTLTIVGDGGSDSVNIGTSLLTLTSTFGTVPITYTNVSSLNFIIGTGANVVTQTATGGPSVTFSKTNASDTINVSAGSMTIPIQATGATVPVEQLGMLLVGLGAQVTLGLPTGSAGHGLLEVGAISIAGSTGNWQGQLDLNGNDLILHNTGSATAASSLVQVTNQLNTGFAAGLWNGMGITSSAAAEDSSHLTTVGAIWNDNGSGMSLEASFDGTNASDTDLLLKTTLYGDADLSGVLDGSDYSRIDSGYLTHATGWLNGDFNYDGVVNGSDYTLIDNAYNMQGASPPIRLAIITTTPTLAVGSTSGSIVLQLRSALGQPANAPAGGVVVNLASSSSGATFYSGSTPITSILVPGGSSSVSFAYRDTVAGTPLMTASATGLFSASQTATITAVPSTAQLAFSTSPLNQAVGSISGAITLTLEDSTGTAISAGSGGVAVSLTTSSGNGQFESLANSPISTVIIPGGATTVSFKYSDTTPGLPVVTASNAGIVSATQQESVTAALTSIAFTTPAHVLVVGASPATVTIQLEDHAGNSFEAGAGGVVVSLSANSSGGTFYNSLNSVVTTVTVPAGASSVTVAYRDTNLGSPTLRASVTGLTVITQQQYIVALPTGTVAYYGFNTSGGLLADSSGSANTLAVGAGTVSYNSTLLPAGFIGSASFSNSGYLTTSSGSFPVNVPTGNSTYTLAAWIDTSAATQNGIVGWGNWGATDQTNAFRTTQGDAGASDGAGLDNYWWNDDYVQSSPSLVGNWVYAAVSYNGAARSIYANGVLLGTYANVNPDNSQPINFRIGSTDAGEYFTGNMADLLIANTALSSNQIDELYNGVVPIASAIGFATPAHTLIVGASPATVTIQLQNAAGMPAVNPTAATVVSLSTNSSGGTFYNSANGAITSVTIPAGQTSVSVAYRDSQVGSPTLKAVVTGYAIITQQQSVGILPTGVVAYYGFNTSSGLLHDSSGSGNTLKLGGGNVAFTTTGLPAGFTGAANFNSNGYLTTSSGNFPTNVPLNNSTYTIAAWIDINNANKNGIVGWGNWGTTDSVNAFRTTQGDAGANDGAGLDNYWWNNDYVQPTVSLVNNWVYVAATYNGSVRSMYVNGVLVGTFNSGTDAATPTNFRVGSTNNGEFFGGNMADLLIANTAFSTTQIDALYNGT